jgi:hypothetical protein
MKERALLDGLLRLRYVVLALLATVLAAIASIGVSPDNDWSFFAWGSDILFGAERPFIRSDLTVEADQPGGLHLYASYPFIQIGPPALLIAALLGVASDQGAILAGVLVQLLGLVTIVSLERSTPGGSRHTQLAVLLGGGLLTVVWLALTSFRHLDDALTLTGLALRKRTPALAGVCLGLAAASKPWGVALLSLTLVPDTWWERARCVAAAVVTAAVWWLPFILTDSRTLALGQVGLFQSADSPLNVVDLDALLTAQELRWIQFGAGLLIGVVLVAAGQWHLAPLAAFCVRLLIEPSTYEYYGAAVVVAALVADMDRAWQRLPWFTIVAASGWVAAEATQGAPSGVVRICLYGGLLISVLAVAAANARTTARKVAQDASSAAGNEQVSAVTPS